MIDDDEAEHEAAMMADADARRTQSERDEVLRWCQERAAASAANAELDEKKSNKNNTRANTNPANAEPGPTDELGRPLNDPRFRLNPEVVTRSYSAPAAVTAQTPAAVAKAWKTYIRERLESSERVMRKTIAAIIVDEIRQREAAEAQIIAKLDIVTAQMAELRAEVAELRAAALKRSKPANPDEARQRAGEIRRNEQVMARARAA